MRLLFLFAFLLCVSKSNAQVIECSDSKNTALSKVHIKILSSEGKILLNDFTNEKGILDLEELDYDTVLIKATHIGFIDYLDTVSNTYSVDTLKIELEKFSFPLNEVVITSQIEALSQRDAVNNIISISKNEIEELNSLNLSELLNQQALFDIQFDPALGSSIEMQGMSGNNINILVDGIPVIGRKGGQIDISQLNLSNIEKIEIVRGPSSVSYGTNSTGGVINLITKSDNIPEFLFFRCNPKNFYNEAIKILKKKKYAEAQLISSKEAIRELGYGSKDPSIRAAKSIKTYFKLD